MSRNFEPLSGITGVASGSRATVAIPVKRRVHKLIVVPTATGETEASAIVERIRLLVNGKVMREITPDFAQAIEDLNNVPRSNDTSFAIHFSEPWRRTVTGEEATSWDLFAEQTCVLEVVFKSGLTAPALEVWYEYDFMRNVARAADGKIVTSLSIIKMLPQSYSLAAGRNTITTLPTLFPIQKIHFATTDDCLAQTMQLIKDGVTVLDTTETREIDRQKRAGFGEAALNGAPNPMQSLIADIDQQISSPWIVNQSIELRLTMSDVGTIDMICEQRANGFV